MSIPITIQSYALNWYYTTHSQQKISQVLEMLDLLEIWIFPIIQFVWLTKETITIRKRQTEHDGVVMEGET